MRAVMGKEFRELLVVALPLWIVAAVVAASEIAGSWDHTEDMVGTAIIGGLALGLAQGILDQLRRDDEFLKHRPLSADRLQLARMLAGLFVLAIALLAFFASLWIATWAEAFQLTRLRSRAGMDFLPWHDPIHYGLATHALVVTLGVASWALARFVTGLRPYALIVPACLVVPVAAWAVLARMPTTWSAGLLAAVFALLLAGLVHARETGRRGLGSHALLLGLLAFVALEGALWARSGLSQLQQDLLPRYGLAEDGGVRYWDWSWKGGEVELAAERRVLRRWPQGRADGAPSLTLRVQGSLRGEDGSLAYEQMDDPRFIPPTRRSRPLGTAWGDSVASALSAQQRWSGDPNGVRWTVPQYWSYMDGVLVCWRGRRAATEILAWVGPDGFHEGAPGPNTTRFPDGLRLLAHDPVGGPWTVTSVGEGDSYVFRVVPDPEAPPLTPIRLDVVRRPLAPYEGKLSAVPTVIPDRRRFWLLDLVHGLLAPRAIEDDEYVPRSRHGWRTPPEPGGLETWLVPQHPTRYGARLRYFDADRREQVADVHLAPLTSLEKLPEAGMGLLGMLRPPLLNAWAFFSNGPGTRSEMNRWWWRDPLFSSASYLGWFLASLGFGALMALLAWRSARLRLPTRGAQLGWALAVFLLGPLGLLWMKLAIGRTALLPVGDGRRAVDLEATPDNPAPWPEPKPRGTEVFS